MELCGMKLNIFYEVDDVTPSTAYYMSVIQKELSLSKKIFFFCTDGSFFFHKNFSQKK